jgi:hypothetical protein
MIPTMRARPSVPEASMRPGTPTRSRVRRLVKRPPDSLAPGRPAGERVAREDGLRCHHHGIAVEELKPRCRLAPRRAARAAAQLGDRERPDPVVRRSRRRFPSRRLDVAVDARRDPQPRQEVAAVSLRNARKSRVSAPSGVSVTTSLSSPSSVTAPRPTASRRNTRAGSPCLAVHGTGRALDSGRVLDRLASSESAGAAGRHISQ